MIPDNASVVWVWSGYEIERLDVVKITPKQVRARVPGWRWVRHLRRDDLNVCASLGEAKQRAVDVLRAKIKGNEREIQRLRAKIDAIKAKKASDV